MHINHVKLQQLLSNLWLMPQREKRALMFISLNPDPFILCTVVHNLTLQVAFRQISTHLNLSFTPRCPATHFGASCSTINAPH